MRIPARLRAGLVVSLLWGAWAGALGAAFRGVMLLLRERNPADTTLPLGPLVEAFLRTGAYGALLGALFALALAFARRPALDGRLSAGRAALLGAMVGPLIGAAFVMSLPFWSSSALMLWGAGLGSLLSAGLGAAMVGSATPKALRARHG